MTNKHHTSTANIDLPSGSPAPFCYFCKRAFDDDYRPLGIFIEQDRGHDRIQYICFLCAENINQVAAKLFRATRERAINGS